MRTSERFLTLALVIVCGLAACSRGSESVDAASGVAPTDSGAAPTDSGAAPTATTATDGTAARPGAQAPYGVVANVSYTGDRARLTTSSRVYLFLREKGARMPLAVQYFDAAELPKRASLSTREALSNVELVARLSLSGRVERSPGDPETSVWLTRVGHPPETVELRLADGAEPPAAPGPTAGAAAPTPAPATSVRALAGSVRARAISVRARVTIDSKAGLAPDATVFVIARDGRNPMPLAVRKLTVAELPAEIELSDADAMLMTRRLSDAGSFTLLARVSTSGRVERSAGDPESAPVAVDTGAIPEQVTLAIRTDGGTSQTR